MNREASMLWLAILYVFLAGLVGGVANALMSDNGFVLPMYEGKDGARILRPGYLGNMVIGGIAAVVSWGLYGPASSFSLLAQGAPAAVANDGTNTGKTPAAAPAQPPPPLTVASLVGGVLVGVAGARW